MHQYRLSSEARACESTRALAPWQGHKYARVVRVKPCHAAVVDKPPAAEQPVEPEQEVGSGCPVLRALQPLPPPPLSALDDLLTFATNIDEHRERTYQGKPMSSGRYMGLLPGVFLYSPEVVKEVLVHEAAGTVRAGWPVSVQKLLGENSSLVTTDVVTHKFLRKLMAPALGSEAVDHYLDDIHAICSSTLDSWVAQCAEGRLVKAAPELKNLTLKVITTAILDMPLTDKDLEEVSRDFKIWIAQWFFPFPHDVWPLPYYGAMRARDRLRARIEKRMAAVKQELAQEASSAASHIPKRKFSTLRRLMTEKDEHGNTLNHQQVVDNLLTLLFAGHDTTASQLATLLRDMALHPEVMTRLRAEQQQVMSRHGPNMTPAALKDMKYAAAVLSEVFRLTPVVGAVPRKAMSDFGLQGHQVKAGMSVVLGLGIMMKHDPRWPAEGDPATNPLHPANFNPDRFMTEEGQKQGWQVPFGTGPRICAGMALAQAEAKIFLATLARGYDYIVDENTEWVRKPLPQPTNGLPVWMTRRA